MRAIDADALMTELMDSDLDHLQRDDWKEVIQIVADAPTITPEPHEIGYDECANALLKMWMDGILTDWVYNRIADKLNEKWGKTEFPEPYKVVTDGRF